MSPPEEFSQYRRKEPKKEGGKVDSEFSQYLRKPEEPKRGFIETYVTRPAQIAGQGFAAGLRALPRTGYDLLKTVAAKAGGDISQLEESEKNAPDWLKSVGRFVAPTFEEVRERQATEEHRSGPLAQPEGPVERGIEKFGRFVGEAPAFGGVGGAKGLASLAGAAGGLQVAEENDLGPMGHLIAGAAGSFVPGAVASTVKGAAKAITSPKQTLASGVAKVFTPKDKALIQKQIIQNARDAGITLDAGTITGSRIIQNIQTKLAQSGFTGQALENLRKQISEEVVSGYKSIAEDLGKAQFESVHEAGDVLQKTLVAERDFARQQYRDLYQKAKGRLTESSQVYPDRIINLIKKLEGELSPGSLKGNEQKAVLQFLEDLKKDVMLPDGTLKGAKVKDLINDKVAIHDIVDYEIQGGAKQTLKQMAKEIDETIQTYGRSDPRFAQEYKLADKKFGESVRTFRNKNISSSLKSQDPRQVMNKMNTTQGIRDVKKALSGSAEGMELFNDLSRFKLDQVFQKNLQDGVSNQLKFGNFSNVFKNNANNREIVRELLGNDSFRRLENLMKTSGNLAETSNKFFNSSQSATSAVDLGVAATLIKDIGHLLSGNPFPLVRSGGIFSSVRQLSKLLSDPSFLKHLENAVLAGKSGNPQIMQKAASLLKESAQMILRQSGEVNAIPEKK